MRLIHRTLGHIAIAVVGLSSATASAQDAMVDWSAHRQSNSPGAHLQCDGAYINPSANVLPVRAVARPTVENAAAMVPQVGGMTGPALMLSASNTDPDTAGAGNKRCELSFSERGNLLPFRKSFFFTVDMQTEDWSGTSDDQLIWQWHEQSPVDGLPPFLAAYIRGGVLRVEVRHSLGNFLTRSTLRTIEVGRAPWVPGQWNLFLVRAVIDPTDASAGLVDVSLNGERLGLYRGKVGYPYAVPADYLKVGIYHWTNGNPWDAKVPTRRVYVRRVLVLPDMPKTEGRVTVPAVDHGTRTAPHLLRR